MMSPRRPSSSPSSRCLLLGFILLLVLLALSTSARATGVFKVRRKFVGRRPTVGDLRAHDSRRHSRILSAVDLPLGGLGLPTDTGLYFAEIGIGMPSKKYYVQVDTGSDILWVNCISCKRCPRKSDLGVELTLYDPKASGSGSLVSCQEKFCVSTYGDIPGCEANLPCQYSVMYGDGSSTSGYFVTDTIQYNQVSGNHQTKPSNSSMISQLASSGKVSKIFAHCLDTINGGGIFTIGHVVQPKVKTTPLVPDQPHYNVNLKAIEVGGAFLQLPTDLFDTGDKKGTIIDSGTTLSYLPEVAYKALMSAVLSNRPDLSFFTNQDFLCFRYTGSVDDGFPEVVFHFENSLLLNVYPHDYLFQNGDNIYCVGWQNGGLQSKDGKDMFLLGGSSSIKIRDDKSGAIYTVDAHNISSGRRLQLGRSILLLLPTLLCYFIC
ncbi:hypothetical protein C4D60_Mb06t28780 [Musa balbisiana]|uniref:Peptidase A1 domain-containing protein n=1 Tax=Musa balbisiana TaxID=52838 RepID=A0A4S8IRD9_MUSBA|nr:hypothetical protein C4D60_Mb06t28780 [Musa balbisiana]